MADVLECAAWCWGLAVALVLPLHWLLCRLTAERCPRCASKWRTELFGEWDGEMWDCRACGHYWDVRY